MLQIKFSNKCNFTSTAHLKDCGKTSMYAKKKTSTNTREFQQFYICDHLDR